MATELKAQVTEKQHDRLDQFPLASTHLAHFTQVRDKLLMSKKPPDRLAIAKLLNEFIRMLEVQQQ